MSSAPASPESGRPSSAAGLPPVSTALRSPVACALVVVLASCALPDGPQVAVELAAANAPGATGIAGTAILPAPSVRALDRSGRAVRGAEVTFSASHGGQVANSVVSTDADGIASVGSWILGGSGGTQILTASGAGLPSVTFTVNALAPPLTFSLQGITVSASPPVLPEGWSSRIELLNSTQFSATFNGEVGYGTYAVAGVDLSLDYSDDFLLRVANLLEPGSDCPGAPKERGQFNTDFQQIHVFRCLATNVGPIWIYGRDP